MEIRGHYQAPAVLSPWKDTRYVLIRVPVGLQSQFPCFWEEKIFPLENIQPPKTSP
jgi:hypothetical protein